jgi:hypothetical protein
MEDCLKLHLQATNTEHKQTHIEIHGSLAKRAVTFWYVCAYVCMCVCVRVRVRTHAQSVHSASYASATLILLSALTLVLTLVSS